MHYDPIKKSLGKVFNKSPYSRILFYHLLDLLLLRTWHIRRELKKWKQTAPKEAHILDAGAGFGQYTYFMSKFSDTYCILGVDVKSDQIGECNAFFQAIGKQNVMFKKENLIQFRKENCFDLILCVDVLEHIEDDVKVMENFQHSLRKGGMLLISTPSDQGGSDVNEAGDTSFIEEHVRNGYGVREIKEKLRRSGFSRTKVHYSYGVPGRLSWLISMKFPMKLLHFSRLFFIFLPFYYVVVMPFALVLNFIDSRTVHASGTGLIVLAWK